MCVTHVPRVSYEISRKMRVKPDAVGTYIECIDALELHGSSQAYGASGSNVKK